MVNGSHCMVAAQFSAIDEIFGEPFASVSAQKSKR